MGTIKGGAGSDTISIATLAGAQTVDLGANTIAGVVGGFSSIESFIGDNANDILQLAGGPSFTNFGALAAGANGDAFTFTGAGSMGTITGGAGSDTISIATLAGAQTGDLGGNTSA